MNDGLQKQDTFRFCIRKICTELYFFTQYSEDPDRRKSNNKNFYIYFFDNLLISACAILRVKNVCALYNIYLQKFSVSDRGKSKNNNFYIYFCGNLRITVCAILRVKNVCVPGSDLQPLKQFIDRF